MFDSSSFLDEGPMPKKRTEDTRSCRNWKSVWNRPPNTSRFLYWSFSSWSMC